ncbi:MAG TPA: 16S rRNA (cytidine(1402)-2'-O)-methyltransferase [Bryobacteraceae bacterium]|nr:16S rRNA (cytidine(1402)-2'-O)-methyltransferase [Bryobacteraceae bacterium]
MKLTPLLQRYTANGLPANLFLVATPIGNLEDITLRALRVLREEVIAIACEDTRQTQKLLVRFEIQKPLISYHEHNEKTRAPELIERLKAGESIALVSDAGTPLLSDPGHRLVTAAIENGIRVVPIPGVSAALAALTASGLPATDFRFCGFLPHKAGARRRLLEALKRETATLIFYESPHRILEALEDIDATLGNAPVVLARELTKVHEEFLRGNAAEILAELRSRPSVKGEMTLIIAPSQAAAATGDPVAEVARLEAAGMNRMEAIKTVAREFGLGKRDLYRKIMAH